MDFKASWARQGLTPEIEEQLTAVAYEVFEVIVSPEGGFSNVTEWAKKEICGNVSKNSEFRFRRVWQHNSSDVKMIYP